MRQLPRRNTTCVIAGGGPAGIVLGLLLARAGIEVTVLENMPISCATSVGTQYTPRCWDCSTIWGFSDALSNCRSQRSGACRSPARTGKITVADFRRLPLRHPYVAMVPQWDLLTLLANTSQAEACFTLLTEHEATGVLRENSRVVGLSYRSPDSEGEMVADMTVACDGRWSMVRGSLGLEAREFPVGFDVWW